MIFNFGEHFDRFIENSFLYLNRKLLRINFDTQNFEFSLNFVDHPYKVNKNTYLLLILQLGKDNLFKEIFPFRKKKSVGTKDRITFSAYIIDRCR